VLLFTPGLGWLPSDYSVLLEDLASHGYVVVGLASPGFADVVRFAARGLVVTAEVVRTFFDATLGNHDDGRALEALGRRVPELRVENVRE